MTQWLLIMILTQGGVIQQHFVTKKSCEKMKVELDRRFGYRVVSSFCIEHNVLD